MPLVFSPIDSVRLECLPSIHPSILSVILFRLSRFCSSLYKKTKKDLHMTFPMLLIKTTFLIIMKVRLSTLTHILVIPSNRRVVPWVAITLTVELQRIRTKHSEMRDTPSFLHQVVYFYLKWSNLLQHRQYSPCNTPCFRWCSSLMLWDNICSSLC